MVNQGLSEIQLIGKKQVELWLISNGYTDILKEPLGADEYGLKAAGSIENILVQFRTFLHPQRPFKLSDYEIDKLIRRATKQKLIAYTAYVVIDDKNELVGEINWERLC